MGLRGPRSPRVLLQLVFLTPSDWLTSALPPARASSDRATCFPRPVVPRGPGKLRAPRFPGVWLSDGSFSLLLLSNSGLYILNRKKLPNTQTDQLYINIPATFSYVFINSKAVTLAKTEV